MALKAKGIYIGKCKLNDVEYPIAIYSEKDIIDNITKVQVSEISELDKEENRKHLRAEETFIKYLIIAFYEEGINEPVLMIQIEKFDISKLQNTKEKWLEFLKIFIKAASINSTFYSDTIKIYITRTNTGINSTIGILQTDDGRITGYTLVLPVFQPRVIQI